MNKIDTLIAYLFAIQAFAKDIHYSASGEVLNILYDLIQAGLVEKVNGE